MPLCHEYSKLQVLIQSIQSKHYCRYSPHEKCIGVQWNRSNVAGQRVTTLLANGYSLTEVRERYNFPNEMHYCNLESVIGVIFEFWKVGIGDEATVHSWVKDCNCNISLNIVLEKWIRELCFNKIFFFLWINLIIDRNSIKEREG